MRLFYFVQQHDCMWILGDCFGQQAALIETDISRRRTDQSRDCVSLHVLGHVEANQLHTHNHRKLTGHFGLADAGRTGKQE